MRNKHSLKYEARQHMLNQMTIVIVIWGALIGFLAYLLFANENGGVDIQRLHDNMGMFTALSFGSLIPLGLVIHHIEKKWKKWTE